MKDVLNVNTSNTSSNTSDSESDVTVLKNGKTYSSVLKARDATVSDVLFSWQDVLNDVLTMYQLRYWGCIDMY